MVKHKDKDERQVMYNIHKRKVEAYLTIKKHYIKMAKEQNDIMVCEFDYAQNLPLPKLTVTSQFYKRLLWPYTFLMSTSIMMMHPLGTLS